tara:strand:- start:126 stop:272 length:147 start_codon:yes stop_codon:yes gene_type:complete
MTEYQAGLDPAITTFLALATIVGQLAIMGVIFLLKKIEKEDPERIRWK